jgi:hypothetical protein
MMHQQQQQQQRQQPVQEATLQVASLQHCCQLAPLQSRSRLQQRHMPMLLLLVVMALQSRE